MVERPTGPLRISEGMWIKCPKCKEVAYAKEVARRLKVCPKCGYHYRLTALERLTLLADDGAFSLFNQNIQSVDPLKFKDKVRYRDRIKKAMEKTGLKEAVLSATLQIKGIPTVVSAMDFRFMGGSMGSAVGEIITQAAEKAKEMRVPFITIACSGGARMQEGVLSLMQLAKVSAAIGALKKEGLPFISILTDPTTGGVTASFAMQGDVNIAEPGALIGFAGPRVIEQTIRQSLPEGFQRSEFLLEKGMLDMVVPRDQLKETVGKLLHYLYG